MTDKSTYTCACGTIFRAREADRKRGWARSCSKSCAAKLKALKPKRTRRYAWRTPDPDERGVSVYGESWDDHKFC